MPISTWVIVLIRILTGALFTYSGWSKLISPVQEFEYVIEQYQLFPSPIIRLIAHALPWIELVFGTFLLIGFMRTFGAQVLCGLCAAFLLLLASTLIRGIDVGHCGCFGKGILLTVTQAFTLDSCLVLILMFLSTYQPQRFELDQWLGGKK